MCCRTDWGHTTFNINLHPPFLTQHLISFKLNIRPRERQCKHFVINTIMFIIKDDIHFNVKKVFQLYKHVGSIVKTRIKLENV